MVSSDNVGSIRAVASLRIAMFDKLFFSGKKNNGQLKGDWRLLLFPVLLSIIGLVMIFEASSVMAIEAFGDRLYFFRHQLVWFTVSLFTFLLVARVDINLFRRFSMIFLLGNIVLLVLVLIPGIGKEILGGRRWISIAGINLQPSELMKISLSLYLASILPGSKKNLNFFIITGFICSLIMLQPDMGTTVIIAATALIVYFVNGAKIKTMLKLSLAGVIVLGILVLVSPYRYARLTTFFNPQSDPQGQSYHVNQILIALGNGGWFGQGLGMSRQKYLYIPEVTTDSIFAILAEETGFIGTFAVICLFCAYLYVCCRVLLSSGDVFKRLFGIGLVSVIGVQFIVNLGAIGAMLPLTGIPLPFISYGGSAMLINFICAGIIYNISKKAN